MWLLFTKQRLAKRMKWYGLHSQKKTNDPLIVARLFDVFLFSSRYISEYSQKTGVFHAYYVCGACSNSELDWWEYTSFDEMKDSYRP